MTDSTTHGRAGRFKRCAGFSLLAATMLAGVTPAAIAQTETDAMLEALDAAFVEQHAMPADLADFPKAHELLLKGNSAGALRELLEHQSEHENDPRFFNLVGAIALKVPDYAAAASAFERVVVMQPDNAGAWLDLAIATAELGNTVSALGYFEYIENEFDPPQHLRAIIARYRTRLASRAKVVSSWQSHLQAFAGVDTNANSGLQNGSIPLTVGAERIELTLDPNYRARSDAYAQTGAGVGYRRQIAGNLIEAGAGMRQRLYHREHDFSTLDLNLSAGMQRPTAYGDAGMWMHVEHLSLGGKSLMRNMRAVLQVEQPRSECRTGFAAEAEWRRYSSLVNLDANVYWAQTGIACDWNIASVVTQTTLIARFGLDTPVGDRPGGKTRRAELAAQVGAPIAWGGRLDISTALSWARDTEGYSPLLENNAIRKLVRRNARATMTFPVGKTSDLIFLLEDNRFASNLLLFEQNGRNLSVGLRRRF